MIIIDDIEQNTPEWEALKLGVPSSSAFGAIITSTGRRAKGWDKYIKGLAEERRTGKSKSAERYYGHAMQLGHEREDEARATFELNNNVDIKKVAVVYKDETKRFLCSPDGLLSPLDLQTGFETKNALEHVQEKRLNEGWGNRPHFIQVQGSLYITGFKYWYLQSYSRGYDPVIIKYERDEVWIKQLEIYLYEFCNELDNIIEPLKKEI